MLKKMTEMEKQLRNSFGKALEQGHTLADVASAAGISPSQLSRFHRHERQITLPTAGALAHALGLVLGRRQ